MIIKDVLKKINKLVILIVRDHSLARKREVLNQQGLITTGRPVGRSAGNAEFRFGLKRGLQIIGNVLCRRNVAEINRHQRGLLKENADEKRQRE